MGTLHARSAPQHYRGREVPGVHGEWYGAMVEAGKARVLQRQLGPHAQHWSPRSFGSDSICSATRVTYRELRITYVNRMDVPQGKHHPDSARMMKLLVCLVAHATSASLPETCAFRHDLQQCAATKSSLQPPVASVRLTAGVSAYAMQNREHSAATVQQIRGFAAAELLETVIALERRLIALIIWCWHSTSRAQGGCEVGGCRVLVTWCYQHRRGAPAFWRGPRWSHRSPSFSEPRIELLGQPAHASVALIQPKVNFRKSSPQTEPATAKTVCKLAFIRSRMLPVRMLPAVSIPQDSLRMEDAVA